MKKKLLFIMITFSLVFGLSACATKKEPAKVEETEKTPVDDNSSATVAVDGTTSASIMPENLIAEYKPKGFTSSDKKKALFVVGDPRKYSVNYDLINTAMKHFEDQGVEVQLRDLYDMEFNPVLSEKEFYYAKDGFGEPSETIKTEQAFVSQADMIIFAYPNWHDTPNAIVKGYMETVFAKQFAYKDKDGGLEGLLKGKEMYTIMNAGFLGGGRGYFNDGVGINDDAWFEYMEAFRVLDEDTAGFWGLESKGRFINDRTPKNNAEDFKEKIEILRADLINALDKDLLK